MSRLLNSGDIDFLRRLPGFTPRMESGFRSRRCRIFRGYLRGLRAELMEINTEFDTLAIECPELKQELALALFHGRLRFASTMLAAHICLWRYRWGLGKPDCGHLIHRFDVIRDDMRRWIPEIS